jgi:hypothetical protein
MITLVMSQGVLCAGTGTYVEIYSESLDVDLAVRRESDAVNAEECLDGKVMCQCIFAGGWRYCQTPWMTLTLG